MRSATWRSSATSTSRTGIHEPPWPAYADDDGDVVVRCRAEIRPCAAAHLRGAIHRSRSIRWLNGLGPAFTVSDELYHNLRMRPERARHRHRPRRSGYRRQRQGRADAVDRGVWQGPGVPHGAGARCGGHDGTGLHRDVRPRDGVGRHRRGDDSGETGACGVRAARRASCW